MTELKNKTVAEIVTEDIATASIFKKNGIDFCCGGKVQLDEICTKKDIDTATVVGQLEELMNNTSEKVAQNPDELTLTELADYIVETHHAYINENFNVIIEFADKVSKVHGHGAPEVVEVATLVHALHDELMPHMMKEEMMLFPFIKQLDQHVEGTPAPMPPFGTVNNPIRMMEMEHDSAGENMARIHEITSAYQPPEWACNTYRALYHMLQEFEDDLHIHIHLENNILFPKASALEAKLNG